MNRKSRLKLPFGIAGNASEPRETHAKYSNAIDREFELETPGEASRESRNHVKLFFSIFSTIASLGILWYLYKARAESLAFRTSLALILGGAVGNLIDRVFYGIVFDEGPFFYGKVVDFIDADFFNVNLFGFHMSRWPIFNIADASVTCGVILLLLVHRHSTREEPFADTSPLVGSPGSESEVVTARAVVQDPSQSPASSESSQS